MRQEGKIIDEYILLRFLGEGAYGEVYHIILKLKLIVQVYEA